MYERRSRLKSHQQGELLKMFVVGATARAVAEVVGVHRNTAAVFFMPLRKLIASKLPGLITSPIKLVLLLDDMGVYVICFFIGLSV